MDHRVSRRLTGIVSLFLLLLSLSAGSAAAGVRAPSAPTFVAPATVIGTNSCADPADCAGATGPIGDNSCNGQFACIDTAGSIADNSCNGYAACYDVTGDVGANSCDGTGACDTLHGAIGANSCDGTQACFFAAGSVGANSCNGAGACYQASSGVGDCADNQAGFAPVVCVQPDAKIRRIGRGHPYGNDIYNTNGANQTLMPRRTAGRKLRMVITIQNDGAEADSFVLSSGLSTGPTSVGPTLNFYHGWPQQDITADVVAGTFTTPVIAPGGRYRLRALVTPPIGSTFIPSSGIGFSYLVTATSVGNPAQIDAVGFVVEVAPTT